MSGTMTFVGLDVHARSVHGSAIDVMSGELTRLRFRGGAWRRRWRGCGRCRARCMLVMRLGRPGSGSTAPRGRRGSGSTWSRRGRRRAGGSDRVKTDRKDAELLARLLLAGQLSAITVPPAEVEAARELTRLHDACRRDLMNARHRISKMLLRHGRVYPKPTTWKQDHRQWLAGQRFDEPTSELVYLNLLAQVDALTARKLAARHGDRPARYRRAVVADRLLAALLPRLLTR